MAKRTRQPPGPAVLWAVACVVTVAAGVWQWHRGASGPQRGEVKISGQRVSYQLPSRGTAGEPLRVTVGVAPEVAGTVRWRHSQGEEPFQALTMLRDDDVLVSLLPAQPAGGWIEYELVLFGAFGLARIPSDEPVQVRSWGRASPLVVLPYLAAALLSVLFGVRAGLAAGFERPEARLLTWIAAACVTVCGVILGPLVQRSAFGAYWTGWPLGADVVDHKALVVWLAWIVAAVTMVPARGAADRFARTVVTVAAAALVAVAFLPDGLHVSRLPEPGEETSRATATRHRDHAPRLALRYSTEGSEGRPSSS